MTNGDYDLYFFSQSSDFAGEINFDGEEYGDISTWYILAMSQKEFAQANLVGSLSTMYWPYLEKVVKEEEGGAKAFAKRGAPRRIKK